jgi:hypothetical protein
MMMSEVSKVKVVVDEGRDGRGDDGQRSVRRGICRVCLLYVHIVLVKLCCCLHLNAGSYCGPSPVVD